MNAAPSPTPAGAGLSTVGLLGGLAFVVVWLGAAALWAVTSLMGGLMANDAGRLAADRHTGLLLVMLVGEILVGLAGIVAALAIALPTHRAGLLRNFAVLLALGLLAQAWAIWSFVTAAAG